MHYTKPPDVDCAWPAALHSAARAILVCLVFSNEKIWSLALRIVFTPNLSFERLAKLIS